MAGAHPGLQMLHEPAGCPPHFLFPPLISSQEAQEQDGSSDSLLEEYSPECWQPEWRSWIL